MRKQDRRTKPLTLTREMLRHISLTQLAVAQGGSAYPAVEYDVAPPGRDVG